MSGRTKSSATTEDGHTTKKKGERAKKSPKLDGQKKSKSSKKEATSGAGSGGGGSGVRGQSQSCHQCRQSIHSSKGVSEVKSGRERLKCSKCTRYWCEQCLHNRYGVVKCEQDPASWICPVCSGNCNCSLCRKKAGKLATGILTPLIKSAGFGNVSDFLDKGTDDIAKVLQWKSPEIAAADSASQTKKKRKLEPSATVGAQSKPKRKRRAKPEDAENSTTLANTPSPVSGYHGNGGAHSSSSKRSNGHCRHGNSRLKRRRRLSHPSYSITVDDDPIDLSESCEQAKLSMTTTFSPVISMETDTKSTEASTPPIKTETKVEGKEYSTPPKSETEAVGSLSADLSSPFRRSQRKRTTTRRYSSHDFRPDFDEEDILFPSPKSKRRRSCVSGREKRVSFRSPLFSSDSVESADVAATSSEYTSVEVVQKQKELEELRNSTLTALREMKSVSRQEVAKEKERLKEEDRRRRKEEKERINEERAKLREQKKLNKLASQEKLKLARNLLREAQKDARRRQKEREKVRKQQQLHLLKEKRQEEKRKRQELTSAPLLQSNQQVSLYEDDSPSSCEAAGLPSLPSLPSLELPFSTDIVPSFLFVSEFLYTFADALELKRRLTLKELSKLMVGGRGLGDLYLSLLQVLVDDDSQLLKQLKARSKQRDLEHLARSYLHDAGKNGFIQGCSSGSHSLTDSLIILHHLCEEAMDSATITEHMEASQEQIDQLRRDERQKEREKSKEISEELKRLCDGRVCSMDEIEAKRKEFTKELEEMRRLSEQEQFSCRLAIRNTFLGRDRYNRFFWKLQSFPGLLVEETSRPDQVQEGIADFDVEDGPSAGAGQWLVVNTTAQLQEIMASLHPRGRREGHLLTSLTQIKDDITTQLDDSTHQSRAKRFYG